MLPQASKRARPDTSSRQPADQLKGYTLSSPKAKAAKHSSGAAAGPAQPSPQLTAAAQPTDAGPQAAASEDDGADLAAAVSAALQNDARVREAAGPDASDSGDDEAVADVVHFPGAYQAHHRKPKQERTGKGRAKLQGASGVLHEKWCSALPTKVTVAGATKVRRLPGELVHAGESQHIQGGDSFEALGLAGSLAEHLEGASLRLPVNLSSH